VAQDALDLTRVLGIDRFSVVGHDWGARTAYTLAALVPERLDSIAALSLAYSPKGTFPVPPFKQSRAWWYQWFMSVDCGADSVREDPIGFARISMGDLEPRGLVHRGRVQGDISYRGRWRHEPKDLQYDGLRERVKGVERLSVPTLMIQGMADGTVIPISTERKDGCFTNGYRRIELEGVGHFPMREAPEKVAAALIEHLRPNT
jgi:pimeloyl-ACP methyl ester carboxylesterase